MSRPLRDATERARRSLVRLELASSRRRVAVRRQLGISDDELSVLHSLVERDGDSLSSLVTLTGLSRSGAGALVQRMEAAGQVERFPDPSDKRVRLIRLSQRGRERVEEIQEALLGDRARVLEGVPDSEIDAVERMLDQLAEAADSSVHGMHADAMAAPIGGDPIWSLWG